MDRTARPTDIASADTPSADTPAADRVDEGPEQLTLLGCQEVPERFRFDRHTRELGLANIAAIKAQLTARAAARAEAEAAARTERLQRRSAA